MSLSIQILFFSFILFAFADIGTKGILTIPEICDNAIDDDGDGQIDLNDSDCFCDLLKPTSFIPNPSFEDQDCCPAQHSSLHCASSWLQASEATPDYYHSCDWAGGANFPQPLPDGEGFVGFIDGAIAGEDNPNWKEYVGACLINPLKKDTLYRFQFNIGFFSKRTSPNTDLVLFGTNDCDNLPFGIGDPAFGCPTNSVDWVRLGSVSAFGEEEWKQLQFIFKPSENITTVVVGPDCYHRTLTNDTYYLLDNLVLAEDAKFDLEIQANDQPCSPDLAFEIPFLEGYTYQWYRDGVAIIGATNNSLNQPLGAGKYEVLLENELGCKVSEPYMHNPPFTYVEYPQTYCRGATYIFNTQELTEPGIYWDTLKTLKNCDSIIRLELKLEESFEKKVTAKIFPAETYQIGNFRFNAPGDYVRTISTKSGCDSTIYLQLTYYNIYIPTIFSPNADGRNDVFSIVGGADLQLVSQLQIFDRWGSLMYDGHTLAPSEGWDGLVSGKNAAEGVYLYQAKILMDDGQERKINGTIALIR